MSRHEVKCINKSDRSNPHERITHIGGINHDGTRWRMTQEAAIKSIESKEYEFYVRKEGKDIKVVVAISRYNNKYIKTESDGEHPNNLLSLPECPKS